MDHTIYPSMSTGGESKGCVVKSEEDGTSTPDGESDTEYSNSDFTTLTTTDASKDGQLCILLTVFFFVLCSIQWKMSHFWSVLKKHISCINYIEISLFCIDWQLKVFRVSILSVLGDLWRILMTLFRSFLLVGKSEVVVANRVVW